MGSSLGNCTVPPTGTTTTRGHEGLALHDDGGGGRPRLHPRPVHVDDHVGEVGGLAPALVDEVHLAGDGAGAATARARPGGAASSAARGRRAARRMEAAHCTSRPRRPGCAERTWVRRARTPIIRGADDASSPCLLLAAASAGHSAARPACRRRRRRPAARQRAALRSGPIPWGSPRSRAAAAYVASPAPRSRARRRAPGGVRGQGRPRRERRGPPARGRAPAWWSWARTTTPRPTRPARTTMAAASA